MTPENFAYWLKGFFELLEAGPKTTEKLVLTKEQVEMIEKHLKSVFQEKIMFPTITYPDTSPSVPFYPYQVPPNPAFYDTGTPLPKPPYTVTCTVAEKVEQAEELLKKGSITDAKQYFNFINNGTLPHPNTLRTSIC